MKATLFILLALLFVLQFQFWVGNGGFIDALKIKERVEFHKNENQKILERNLALKAEVLDLKQGYDAIEERSRQDLGLIKPGETFFQIIDRKH